MFQKTITTSRPWRESHDWRDLIDVLAIMPLGGEPVPVEADGMDGRHRVRWAISAHARPGQRLEGRKFSIRKRTDALALVTRIK